MTYKHFKPEEFDSPDAPGSGKNMSPEFMRMLDVARAHAGVPFKINKGGGYRTKEYNKALLLRNKHASPTSSHMKGLAADISTLDNRTRAMVIQGLLHAGFNRIGIAATFIHVDDDPAKPEDMVWTYI
jgi:zinc D-Ala-D-Ala carboxypeptidase